MGCKDQGNAALRGVGEGKVTAALQEHVMCALPDLAGSARLGAGRKHQIAESPHNGGGDAIG